jgi:hypothetical protein
VICFGGSLVGVEEYRNMILDVLKDQQMGRHAFKYVDDAAKIGAEGLAAAGAADVETL